ncbi:hypothetical protein KKB84_04720 [bacterium]|nr:hypothetical protein [bacterium]
MFETQLSHINTNYKNKYPPLGLIKISAYHKMLGDDVTFFKGKSKELREEKWDRIYVTTLFSFYWKITIETIEFYKRSVYNTNNFKVGGIMASLLSEEIYKETRIKSIVGLLDKPRMLDEDNDIIVDLVVPDYDIIDEIDYNYPTNNAYFAYMTRGCVNKCSFCAVPRLEPEYKHCISIKEQIVEIDKKYGQKKNLLLLDNNVLASNQFPQIIEEIKTIGFYKGAKYQETIKFNLLIERLRAGENSRKILDKLSVLLKRQPAKIQSEKVRNEYLQILEQYVLLNNLTMEKIFYAKDKLAPFFEKYRNKAYSLRYVDFNQGIDPRFIDEQKMELLSELSIKPLRIALDSTEPSYIEKYKNAIKLAAKYGIKDLSNYVLFSWNNDTPDDFYNRLELNIELNEELGIKIYSFPMKYIPVTDKNRNEYIGKHWNWKYFRAIQKVLLVTRGVVMPEKSFFDAAFGKDKNEFHKIMLMPEKYIIERVRHAKSGDTDRWWDELTSLSSKDYETAVQIIKSNNFKNIEEKTSNEKIVKLMEHYS